MADEIYRPVSDEDMESETPPVSAELPIRSLERAAAAGGTDQSELTVEEGAAQRRRQPDRESPEDAHARPIIIVKTSGTGPLSLNEAADDLTYSRGWKLGDDLHEAGFTERQIKEMGHDALERGVRMDPLAPPPPEAKVLEHFGEHKQVLTPTEAANELTSWRERYAAAQQQELAELADEAVQERAEAQQAQQQQQQPTEQPQQQPEMTPAQIERAQIAAERQHITNLKRIEGYEAALRLDYDQLVQATLAAFPGLRNGPPNPADVEQLRVQDPQRFQKLAMADQMLRERQQKIAAVAQQRSVHDREQAQIDAVARAAARAKLDEQFEQIAPQQIPGWERVQGEVRVQARKTLLAAGASENDLQRMWSGDESIDLHSIPAQVITAKAALWDLAQERARQVRQSNLPSVVKPGTYRSASDGDAQSVNELTARLKKATGREAIRLGTALTKAKRAMNGG